MAFSFKRGQKYVIQYQDETGKTRRKTASTDKTITDQMMAQIVRDVERKKCGLTDTHTEAAQMPITEWVTAYQKHLNAKQNSAKHVQTTIQQIESVIVGAKIKRIPDISSGGVENWLDTQRRTKPRFGFRTSNAYLKAMKGFCNWLFNENKINAPILRNLKPLNLELDERHKRRSLKNEDFHHFLRTVQASPETHQRLDGRSRYVLYMIAGLTGLRASEIAALTVKQFDFQEGVINLKATNTKAKKAGKQELNDDLNSLVQQFVTERGLQRDDRLFNLHKDFKFAKLIKKDLKAANIPYEIDGHYFDFHALRGQYATMLDRSGVSMKKAQVLLRHSSIDLTANLYCRPDGDDLKTANNSIRLYQPPKAG